jgi:hypothetical protein
MRREDDEQLWAFLGRLPPPKLSPFFSRNVVRGVREASPAPRSSRWLRWLIPASVATIALITGLVGLHRPAISPTQTSDVDVVAEIDPQDYEVVADLDQLVASDENSLWDDNQTL